MKRQTMTTAAILQQILSSEHLPVRIDTDAEEVPTSDVDRLEAHSQLHEIVQTPQNVRTCCVGCSQDVEFLSTALCVCGGMVCQACQQTEPEGECQHEEHSPADVLHRIRELADGPAGRCRTIEEHWQTFHQRVLNSEGEAIQGEAIPMLRSTFYAGSFAMLTLIMDAFDSPDSKAFGLRMREFRNEMKAWFEEEKRKDTVQ